LALLSIW